MADSFTHGYALLVGVGADLPETVKDATAIRDLLINPKRAAFPQDNVTLLSEQSATRQNILDGFDRLAARVSADAEATALVYYSGHGGQFERAHEPTQYFLCPYGYDPVQMDATALSGGEFTSKIQALTAKKLIVLLDCCHAGGLPALKGDARFTKGAAPPTLLQAMESGSGNVVVASSRSDELSLGGTPNSVFTAVLLEALSGKAARTADGFARVLDVLSYVFAQVPERAKPFPQHPFVNKISALSENFALCYYAGGAKSAPEVPLTAAAPVTSGWAKFKLESERDALMPAYRLRQSKIAFLQKNLAIEAGSAVQFQLEQQILEEQTKLAQMEQRLDEIEQALKELGG